MRTNGHFEIGSIRRLSLELLFGSTSFPDYPNISHFCSDNPNLSTNMFAYANISR